MNDPNFDVMNMVAEVASSQNTDATSLFKPTAAPEPPKEEAAPQEKKPWVPDAELLEGMPEMTQPAGVIYNPEEIIMERDTTLRNIADDDAVAAARASMDERTRAAYNVQDALRRNGIKHCMIPDDHLDGASYHVRIMTAAGDPDYVKGQNIITEILEEVKKLHPEWVVMEDTSSEDIPMDINSNSDQPGGAVPTADTEAEEAFPTVIENPNYAAVPTAQMDAGDDTSEVSPTEPSVSLIMDKSNVSQVAWTPDEMEKIKKSREVELVIKEKQPIEFGSIEEAPDNVLNMVLSTYVRKANDSIGVLPASFYRATFTGLSYAELLDLMTSADMNDRDVEWKKWSICFKHVKNPSIGPWESYVLYKDPESHKEKKVKTLGEVPDGVLERDVHEVTAFEDFLRKTSHKDLDFILWKILCATAMSQEVLSITCRNRLDNDTVCNHEYDWVYSPSDLLQMDAIDTAVLRDMELVGKANTTEAIMNLYHQSPVYANNTVTLPQSQLVCVYGHVSAYDYLSYIHGKLNEIRTKEKNDPTDISTAVIYKGMCAVKCILIPKEDGAGYLRVSSPDHLATLLQGLGEIDWNVIMNLSDMIIQPYEMKFSMRDIVCPKCGSKSNIPITDVTRLLFLVTQSILSVNVTLTKQ